MSNILNQELKQIKSQIDEIVKDLHELTTDIGHQDLAKTVSDLRNRINEPFMFVIVGEVKAGKSSFINALLDAGKEICKVAPSPMTDTIQQIIYGEKEEFISINDHLKKILQPVEILKEIAVVDTPGTNTIIAHHQEITESFIPASDLIIFVFESKNPYRQSAWEFFDYIHDDWRKKIIFVLQQKDLMNDADLTVNIQGVKDYALKKGITDPLVFPVSAKMELEGQKEESGYIPVREYINTYITGGRAPKLKIQNNLESSQNINERIERGLIVRNKQYIADVEFRNDIKETLDNQSTKSANQVDILVENLLAAYDRITYKTENELNDGLGLFSLMKRSISSMFSKKESAQDWLTGLAGNLENGLNTELKKRLNDGVVDIADSIQQMAKMVDLKIKNSHTILKNDHEIFSDIAERRSNVLRDLQETFSEFLNRSESFTDEELFPDKKNLAPNLATGSGIAVIGVIITSVTNTAVLDITGGILTAVGLVFASVSIGLKRRKIINGFHAEIAKGRMKLEEEVSEKLKAYIGTIKVRIDKNFNRFDEMIKGEKVQIKNLEDRYTSIDTRIQTLKEKVGEV